MKSLPSISALQSNESIHQNIGLNIASFNLLFNDQQAYSILVDCGAAHDIKVTRCPSLSALIYLARNLGSIIQLTKDGGHTVVCVDICTWSIWEICHLRGESQLWNPVPASSQKSILIFWERTISILVVDQKFSLKQRILGIWLRICLWTWYLMQVDYELAGIELSTVEHIHIQSACHLDIRIIPMILAPMVKTISIRSYRLSLGLHKSMLYKLRILHKDVIVRIQTSNPMNEDDLEILREMGAKIHKWGGVQRIYLVIKKAKEDILLEIESDEEDLLPRPLSYVQEVPQPDRPAWEQKADPGVQEFEQSQRSYVDYLKFKEL